MIIDCHVHFAGAESADADVRPMDTAGAEKFCLFSSQTSAGTDLFGGGAFGADERGMNDATELLGQVVDGVADRASSVSPGLRPGGALPRSLWNGHGIWAFGGSRPSPITGIPPDGCALALFARMVQLGLPGIFHSAILFGFGDSSRFCSPALYEALISTSRLKFALIARQWAIGG